MRITGRLLAALLILAAAGGPRYTLAEPMNEFISPIGSPVTFEDPRALTEARFIYLYHEIGEDFVTEGGDARIYGLQLRYAVDDNLSFTLTKAGFVDLNPDANIDDQSGFTNLALGPKLTFYGEGPFAGAIGLRYEAPSGSEDVFQGMGGGFLNPYFSAMGAWGPLDITLGTGFRFPTRDSDSTYYDLDVHFDTPIGDFYPTIEFSLMHVVDGGNRLPIDDEGLDFLNLGASGADGTTVVIGGIGGRYRLTPQCDLGFLYQVPMSDSKGSNLIDWRFTADLIVRFQ